MHVDEYQQGFGHLGAEEALKVIMVDDDGWVDRLAINDEVLDELERQDAKWGVQSHVDIAPSALGDLTIDEIREEYADVARCYKHFNGDHAAGWDSILLEEVYEALAESDPERLEAELIQVAAVAQQWVAAIRRRNRV